MLLEKTKGDNYMDNKKKKIIRISLLVFVTILIIITILYVINDTYHILPDDPRDMNLWYALSKK